jgi:hypothetical protein
LLIMDGFEAHCTRYHCLNSSVQLISFPHILTSHDYQLSILHAT